MNKKINKLTEIFTNQGNNQLAQACKFILRTKNKHELEIAVNKHTIDPHKFKKYKNSILDNFTDFEVVFNNLCQHRIIPKIVS